MEIVKIIRDELVSFLGLGSWIEIFKSGDYFSLLTYDGILSAIGPLIPFLLLLEIVRALLYKKFNVEDCKVIFIIHVFNRFVSRFISIAAVAFCTGLFEKYGQYKTVRLVWQAFLEEK